MLECELLQMISKELYQEYRLNVFDLVLGSYYVDGLIVAVEKKYIYWFDEHLNLLQKHPKVNKIVHPIACNTTLQITHGSQLLVCNNNQPITTLDVLIPAVNGCIFTLDRNLFLISSLTEELILFSYDSQTSSYSRLRTFKEGHFKLTYSAKKKNETLVTCSSDKLVKTFDIQTQTLSREMKLPGFCYDIAFIGETQFLIGGQFDDILLYDLRTSKYVSKVETQYSFTSAFGAIEDKYLMLGHYSTLSFLDVRTLRLIPSQVREEQKIWNIIYIRDNRVLLSGGSMLGMRQVTI